jgi:hypothetical protein
MLVGPHGATGSLNSQGRMSHLSSGAASQKGSYHQQSQHPSQPSSLSGTQPGSRLGLHHASMPNTSLNSINHGGEAPQMNQSMLNNYHHDAPLHHQQLLEHQQKAQHMYRQQVQMQKNAHGQSMHQPGQNSGAPPQQQKYQSFRA